MKQDELEFLISQYVDGTLDADRSAALRARLEADESARAMLLEHRRTSEVVRAHAGLPKNIDWDRVAGLISDHIDDTLAAEREQAYRLPVGRWASRAAAVAAVLLVGLVVQRAFRPGELSVPGPGGPLARVIEVAGPVAESAGPGVGAPVIEVAVAPPPAAVAEEAWLAMEILRPDMSRLLVAGGGASSRRPADLFDGN